jgi:hypothetical protein
MAGSTCDLGGRDAAPGITVFDIHGDVTPAAEDALMGADGRINGTSAVVTTRAPRSRRLAPERPWNRR